MHKRRDKEVPHIRRRIADGTDFNEMCVERDRTGEGARQEIDGYGRSWCDYALVCECRDIECAAHHKIGRIRCTSGR